MEGRWYFLARLASRWRNGIKYVIDRYFREQEDGWGRLIFGYNGTAALQHWSRWDSTAYSPSVCVFSLQNSLSYRRNFIRTQPSTLIRRILYRALCHVFHVCDVIVEVVTKSDLSVFLFHNLHLLISLYICIFLCSADS